MRYRQQDVSHASRPNPVVDAAVAGVGLAWLPCWMMAPHILSGELQLVVRGERPLAIHAVWPQTRHLPSKTRAAIDALVQQVPALLADSQGAKAELERPEAPKK
jgi:DNA-binding transcriptional LysR family regulator